MAGDESAKGSLQNWIRFVAVVGIVIAAVLVSWYTVPEQLRGFWPLVAAVSVFGGVGAFFFATGDLR